MRAIPVLHTADLRQALACYRSVFGFTVAQEIPGVVALLRHGPLRLQLWQSRVDGPQHTRIEIDGALDSIFDCHARIARSARAWMGPPPALKPWGAWEFSLADTSGNRLLFSQWANVLQRQ